MKLNKYAIAWEGETYPIKDDDWYVDNVEYVYARSWFKGNLIHGITALVIATLMFMGSAVDGEAEAFGKWFSILGVAEIAYLVFGVNQFFLSNKKVAIPGYFFTFVFGIISIFTSQNLTSKIVFGVFGILLNLFLTVAVPIILLKRYKEFREHRKIIDEHFSQTEAERFKEWSKENNFDFEQTDYDSSAFYDDGEDYENSSSESSGSSSGSTTYAQTDELMQKAMDLFNGYMSTAEMLKKRYRDLCKQYHPDMEGGDEEMFKRINAAYQILQNEVF